MMRTLRMKLFRTSSIDINLWVDLYYDDVWRFCARRVGQEAAKDATQDTFVIATQKSNDYREGVQPKTWLFGIALRVCSNLARKHQREVSLDWIADKPAEPTTESFQTDALRAALSKLSQAHREVVMLHEIEQLTYDEIAATLNIPVGTVKSRLHHAFLDLRRNLNEEDL